METQKSRQIQLMIKLVFTLLYFLNCTIVAFTILAYAFNKAGIAYQFVLGVYQLIIAVIFTFTIEDATIRKQFKYYWRAVLICFIVIGLLSFAEAGAPVIPLIIAAIVIPLGIACYHVYITHQIFNYLRK